MGFREPQTPGLGGIDELSPSEELTVQSLNSLAISGAGQFIRKTGATSFGNATPADLDISATWGNITGTLSDQTDLQNALNLKANLASPTFTGTVVIPTPFTLGAVSVTATGTVMNYLVGVTSGIQGQIDGKQPLDAGLTSLAGLIYASTSFVKMTGADTFSLDTNTYLTGNQTITLSGDITGSGATAIATTLATVNGNVGSFGSSTSIPSFTVNAKGLITAASGNVVIAPAGTLSGTVLNATVVTSSLTAVGIIGTGTWQGAVVDSTYGGTGINNAGRTLTITTNSGTLLFSGAGTTLTVAGTSSINGTNTGDQTISDATITTTDITTNNASTTKHGFEPKSVAPAANALNVVGIANGETVTSMKTILTTTTPSTQAFSDAAAAGTNLDASHSDHKHAMMAAPTTITGNAGTATALETARTIGGVSFNGTANITVASATGGFTVSGGDLALGTNSITITGSIGATGARVLKGWFTDLQVTNAIAGSVTGTAATFTGNLSGDVTSVAMVTTIAAGVVTEAMQILADNTTNNVSTSKHGYAPKITDTAKFLKGDGTWAAPTASVAITEAEIDVGATPVAEASISVTDAGITASSKIIGGVAYIAPTSKDLDELEMDALELKFEPATGSFNVHIKGLEGYIADKFKIWYTFA